MNPKDYPHLRFLNPIEGVTTHRYSHRSYEETEESKKKDDAKKILNFRKSMVLFFKERQRRDRKSTRLNSSHVAISYAVFCLTKERQNRGTLKSHVPQAE